MRLTLTTPPDTLPVEVAEVKSYRRILHDHEDDLVSMMIGAAVSYLDGPVGILGRPIMQQTWEVALAEWPNGDLPLPVCSVSAAMVSYDDADGVEQVLSTGAWSIAPLANIGSGAARPVFAWADGAQKPELGGARFPVRFSLTGGVADVADVPQDIKVLIIMLAGHWLAHREQVGADVTELPLSISALIARHRVPL